MHKPLGRRRFLTGLATAIAVPPVLTACSALGGSSEAAAPEGAPTGDVEKPALNVGVLPIVGAAPTTLGVRDGLFQQALLAYTAGGESILDALTTQVRTVMPLFREVS